MQRGSRMSRRRCLSLAAASGVAGVLPWLRGSLRAESQGPRRLLLVFTPNGTVQDAFWPSPGLSEQDFEFSEITAPLAGYRDRVLFLKGLNIDVAGVGPGGPHQKGVGGLFTNAPLQQGSFVDGDGSLAGWADGISIDQEIARRFGQQTLLPSLELGVRAAENEVRSRISYAGPGSPMPPINSPLQAYERLFARFLDVDFERRARRQSVVDVVQRQYHLIRPELGEVDRQKLEQHLELVRGIERRLEIGVEEGCGTVEAPPDLEPNHEDTMASISGLHVQLLAAAFACDLTRVASVQFSTAINAIRYPWLNSMGSGHVLSHAGPSNLAARAELIARERWTAEQIALLMGALEAIPEGDGSVLDNTLIIWGNELGRGNTHTHSDIPFVMAGGASGAFEMGRFLDFGGVSHGRLWVSVLQAFGVDVWSFGYPDTSDGPLSGLA